MQSIYVNCKLKAEFQAEPATSVCLMLLSSINNESDGIKTFEVYSSYITLASNIFKQAKSLICVMVYIVEKNEGTFSLTSSVQEVHVIFK